jgi:outer membrane protein assembly factor BamB
MFATGMANSGLWAVKPDGHGDVTKSQTAWKISGKAVPRMVSPVVVRDLLFLVADTGSVTCLEIATGHQLWQQGVSGHFIASPIYADGRIYFFNQAGKGYVIKPGRTYELLATNTLATGCLASPAVAGKALFVRTKKHLYRIESNDPTPTPAIRTDATEASN